MARIDEIAPDLYRICIYVPEFDLEFNHFLVRDDEPLLFHTGYHRTFNEMREAVSKLIKPESIRWIGFSHFESDECGSLNKWLDLAPEARPVCTFLAATLSVNDHAIREAKAMTEDDTLSTGRYRYRFLSTAHLPHGWDAGVLYEEAKGTLFCSDLLFHFGQNAPLTSSDIIGRVRDSFLNMQKSPFGYSVPYTPQTDRIIEKLAALKPATIATMHGSSYSGDGAQALRDYAGVLRDVLGT